MKRILIFAGLVTLSILIIAQTTDSQQSDYKSSADKLLEMDRNLTIGGYGEIHYNQPLSSDNKYNGELDAHRIVMLFGYRFNKRTQ